ncbi:DNA polymerase II [Oceanimonas baumannii]|uniref:DNA polymerase n=1 Tax=Oceanimonas baumannii TaxID=129578 RepID=A0A235CKE4_9GAMM|nr:DNA polymerase II [Oceanimonas baumannii]OYD24906.1 DNA polymerase II [Oceanimonas baumannii]TDW59667.1 DNA polymerase-2 [Oceanimonas baumannii]
MNPIQQGFVLTRHSRDRHGQIDIHYWLCTPQGPARVTVPGERALLMIPVAERGQAEKVLSGQRYEWAEPGLQSFSRQSLAVLYFHTMREQSLAVQRLQAAGIEVLEHDFRPHERYLISRFIRGSAEFTGKVRRQHSVVQVDNARLRAGNWQPQFRVLSLDIECSGKGELYSIGLYGDGLARVLMIGTPEPAATDMRWVENERALLHRLEEELAAYDPDILIGWNLVAFDVRLLLKRAELYGIRLKLGRGGESAFLRERAHTGQVFVTVPGRVAIDGIDALKTACYQFDSFSLESVAQSLLGRGKQTEDVANRLAAIMHDFRHNKPKLAAYNLEDCRLVWDIFAHTRVLDFLRLRSQLTGLELDRSGGSVAAFVQVYLPHLHRAGFVAPNLPPGGGLASPGGYVMNSRPGLYRHVLVLDFKSLYPSIIRTFRIDPLGLVLGQQEEDAIPGFRGARFSRTHHFLPDIIAGLWRERDQAKQEHDAPRSQAIKILMNSFYGVLGSGGCRFYDTRLASSITLRGHDIMQQSARRIEAEGHEVIYGDTDSVFVLLTGEYDESSASTEGKRLAALVNEHWRAWLQHELQLESFLELQFESYFARFFMPTIRGREEGSKKRYAGLRIHHGDAGLVFKGLETVRSDWTPLARTFQTELFRLVFNEEDPSDFVQLTLAQTLGGERDEQLVYRKRLRRPLDQYVKSQPPQVRAARLADMHNARLGKPLRYQRKGIIAYVITVNGPEPVEYRQSVIDYQHYVEKQLKPVADAILPFVGLSFEGITSQQLGLF